jgi:hypothetical protein
MDTKRRYNKHHGRHAQPRHAIAARCPERHLFQNLASGLKNCKQKSLTVRVALNVKYRGSNVLSVGKKFSRIIPA